MKRHLDNFSGMSILVFGSGGMVGRALVRALAEYDCEVIAATRDNANLLNSIETSEFIRKVGPDLVILAAAKVGGIHANDTYPADFIYQNLAINQNVIHGAYVSGVRDLIFLGSSCIYPKYAEQPIKEEYLLTGPLEPTNEWYAVAKIAGIKLCDAYSRQHGVNYFSAMPTNLYGPYDNYHPENSHVIPGLIRRFHEAKVKNKDSVTCWGTGKPFREFLYVDDLARGVLHLANIRDERKYNIYNIGTGSDISIGELAEAVKKTTGFQGDIIFDTSKPDGTPRKLMDSTRILESGWRPEVDFSSGLKLAYDWYIKNHNNTGQ